MYAIKSCPDKELIKLCYDSHIGFDYASKSELNMIKHYNRVDAIFANPVKSIEDVKHSYINGHHTYVVDSMEEIIKINSIDVNAEYVIRIVSNELFSSIKFNSKFGINLEEFKSLLAYIKLHNLRFKGLSYHVGSKCVNMKAHYNTISDIIEKYLPICLEYECCPELIDIGGGFGNETQIIELHKELSPLLRLIENYNIRLIAEPGRLFSLGIYEVYVHITGIRERYINGIKTLFITVNDSVYHTFQGKIFDGQTYEPVPLYNHHSNENVRCIIFGQTCDSLDVICENVILPYPKIGDLILFKNMGSYSLASSNGKFNGFFSAKIRKKCADTCI